MKGIVIAGGKGQYSYPIITDLSKKLLAVYDKFWIYYLFTALMLASIRETLTIINPHDLPNYKRLLSNISNFGIQLPYAANCGGYDTSFYYG